SYLAPESLGGTDTSLQALLMAIVGGTRSPLGPIIGTCVLLTVVTCLPATGAQGMVFGGALILILLVAPRGLVSSEWWSAWQRQKQPKRTETANIRGTETVA